MLASLANFIVAFTMGGLDGVTTVSQARSHGHHPDAHAANHPEQIHRHGARWMRLPAGPVRTGPGRMDAARRGRYSWGSRPGMEPGHRDEAGAGHADAEAVGGVEGATPLPGGGHLYGRGVVAAAGGRHRGRELRVAGLVDAGPDPAGGGGPAGRAAAVPVPGAGAGRCATPCHRFGAGGKTLSGGAAVQLLLRPAR
jgi:hypothetical protein